ncbi:uracil DNA glycosylase [Marasmius crinis-equi]|uniref:Uracil DNA glycosylase n=1 Tax=Marasmius crinis-equi TaxID=585013 RepID=A0ABR3FQQ6_9AGAR
MTTVDEEVFLEDIQPQGDAAQEGHVAVAASQESTTSQRSQLSQTDASTSSKTVKVKERKEVKKRQIAITDMFGNKDAKRQKLSPPTASGSGTTSIVKAIGTSQSSLIKPTGPQKLNSIPFSMKSFQESLNEDHRNLLALECQVMGKSWLKLLQDEIKKPYFISLKRFLWERGVRGADDSAATLKVYPSPPDIYAWSNTPLGKVKVVLIGQDPYHGRGQAHGLCFSVPTGVRVPPSLTNIYAELKSEYPDFEQPKHGNLSSWAANGVLMLNACLTVEEAKPGSHANKGWETFTSKVVEVVDRYGGANLGSESTGVGRGVVFLAWGAFAAERVAKLNKVSSRLSKDPAPH